MNDKLRTHIEGLFIDAPMTKQIVELKEEILQNSIDKYNDLISEGKTEESAYNITVANIGDISQLLYDLNHMGNSTEYINTPEYQNYKKKSAICVSISTVLYILCAVPLLILQNEIGLIFTLVIICIATGILVYTDMTKPSYYKDNDTMVENFKEWRYSNTSAYKSYRSICSAISALTVAIYVILTFTTWAFHITWVVFLISAAIKAIVKACFDLNGYKN